MIFSSQSMSQTLTSCLAKRCIWTPEQFECRNGVILSPILKQGHQQIEINYVKKNSAELYEVYESRDASFFLFDRSITSDKETELNRFTSLQGNGFAGRDVTVTEVSTQTTVNGILKLTNRKTKSYPEEESFTLDQSTGKLTLEVKHKRQVVYKCDYQLAHAQTSDDMFDHGPGVNNSSTRENIKPNVPVEPASNNVPTGAQSFPQ